MTPVACESSTTTHGVVIARDLQQLRQLRDARPPSRRSPSVQISRRRAPLVARSFSSRSSRSQWRYTAVVHFVIAFASRIESMIDAWFSASETDEVALFHHGRGAAPRWRSTRRRATAPPRCPRSAASAASSSRCTVNVPQMKRTLPVPAPNLSSAVDARRGSRSARRTGRGSCSTRGSAPRRAPPSSRAPTAATSRIVEALVDAVRLELRRARPCSSRVKEDSRSSGSSGTDVEDDLARRARS